MVAVLVLATVLGALAFFGDRRGPAGVADAPMESTHRVFVVGRVEVLHAGNVSLEEASAFTTLLGLAQSQGFPVQVDDNPGCAYDYVRGIDGLTETASGGWNYYVRPHGQSAWVWQDQAAACRVLAGGEELLWCWVEPDERCAVQP